MRLLGLGAADEARRRVWVSERHWTARPDRDHRADRPEGAEEKGPSRLRVALGMTPVLPLLVAGREPRTVVAYACGKCGVVKRTEVEAAQCCEPRICECGTEIAENYYTACSKCRAIKEAASAEAKYAKAKKIRLADYETEWLYCDCCEEYYSDSSELFDRHADDGTDLPSLAWACEKKILALNATDILVNALEDFYEEAYDNIEAGAIATLQVAMNDFCD